MRPKTILRLSACAALFCIGAPLRSDAVVCAQSTDSPACLANAATAQKVQPTTQSNDNGGDSKFFSVQSDELANVVFILDNSTSMYELPYTKLKTDTSPNALWISQALVPAPTWTPATPAGATPALSDAASCHSNGYFESLRDASGAAYDPTKTYPNPSPGPNDPTYFDQTKAYRYLEWNSTSLGGSDSATACSGPKITSTADRQRCQQCIDAAGYYLQPGTTGATNDIFAFGPTITALATLGPGGNLNQGTSYSYVVTVVAPSYEGGESAVSNEQTLTATSGQRTVNLAWRPSSTNAAVSYNVYRGAPGAEVFLANVAAPTLSYSDTGSATPDPTRKPPAAKIAVGAYVFKGNWLNFNPPKFILARKVLTDFISTQSNSANPVRIGVATYDPQATSPNPALCNGGNNVDACHVKQQVPATALRPGDGGHLLKPGTITGLVPDCGEHNWNASTSKTNQNLLIGAVKAINFGTPPFNEATPLAETLFNVGQFLAGTDSFYSTKYSLPTSTAWLKPEFKAPADPDKGRPFCVTCQTNAVVLITDGLPAGDNNLPQPIRDAAATCGADCGTDLANASVNTLPAVAAVLATNDLNPDPLNPSPAGNPLHNVITHVVALGASQTDLATQAPLLKKTADAGLGQAFGATNTTELSQRLSDAVISVVNRTTAFSSAAIQSLQTGTGSSVYVPRFTPGKPKDPLWKGQLFRFNVFNEFSAGVDKNLDGLFTGTFIVDADQDIVSEDAKGNFIKQKSPATAAKPLWDAGDRLQQKANSTRTIYTAVANGSGWTTTPFVDSDTSLYPYLALTPAICAQIQGNMATAPASPLDATTGSCAKAVIDWARGQDILGTTAPANRTPMLGDIFHSSPVVVDPPVDQFLCATGLHPQCLSTLFGYSAFAQQSSAVQQTLSQDVTVGTRTVDAYEKYWEDHETRPRIVLVGANDGMLHAFDGGTANSPTVVDTKLGFRQVQYGNGTGDEQWGFIPPDQLPRLALMMAQGHQLSLDGDIMVRDVWVDGQGNDKSASPPPADLKKQAEEFHTVAVVSERQGGTHSFALDVTDPLTPKMLWMYPPPCSADEQMWGQTWTQFAPHPPPIGPVLLQTTKTGGLARLGKTSTEERWAVFLNGGHSPYNTRGRALAMLDVFTGAPLFKASYDPTSTGPLGAMRFGFSAAVSLVDYNTGDLSATDGFFDTAVVGDEGGQVWTVRFFEPGNIAASGLVDNWEIARAYEANPTLTNDPRTHQPIYSIASTTVQPNTQTLRAFVGTGDRPHVLSAAGGDCRPDDPMSCASAGCTVSSAFTFDSGPNRYQSTFSTAAGTSSANPAISNPTQSEGTNSNTSCSAASAVETVTVSGCPLNSAGFTETLNFSCSGSTCTDGNFNSPMSNISRGLASTATGQQQNSFMGITILTGPFGSPPRTRTLEVSTDVTGYDQGRVTLADLTDVSEGKVTATTTGVTGTVAGRDSFGWVVKYPTVDEKTATGATLLNSCVVWNSLTPVGGNNACGKGRGAQSSTFQADAFTGAPNCVPGFLAADQVTYLRHAAPQSVLTPPSDFTATVALDPAGRKVRYSTLQIQPSSSSSVNQVDLGGSSDLLKFINSVPLTADQHSCRHGTTQAELAKCP